MHTVMAVNRHLNSIPNLPMQERVLNSESLRSSSYPGPLVNHGGAPQSTMDRRSNTRHHKVYRRTSIPRDETKIRSILPFLRDATSKLYEVCTCTPEIRGQVRPATETDEEFFSCLGDLFRCYRWLAASADDRDHKSKEHFARFTLARLREGISVIERIIPFIDPLTADPWIRVAIRDTMSCGVQVLANCTRNCEHTQDAVWPEFYEIIGPLIILEEDKLLNYVSAAVVNCLNQHRVEQIVDRGYAARIFERISVFGGREDSMVAYEAVFDLAGYLLECPVVAQRDYDLLTLSARCAILNLLSSMFSLSERSSSVRIPSFWPDKIAAEFITNARCLLRLKDIQQHPDEECELVLKTLDMLGNLTSGDELRSLFTRNELLLDKIIDSFIAVDDAGREGNNQLAPVDKLSDVKPEDLVTPSRGVKSQLLRVLANLVYNNPEFEKRASSRHILQRLKENARIDYRNPYVQQWAILAIRNLHFSAAFDDIRKEHQKVEQPLLPGVAHSLDGDGPDMSFERKHSDGLVGGSLKWRGFQHSETVEALDLHVSHSESSLYDPRHVKPVRKTSHQHLSRTSRKHGKKSAQTDQETQTATADTSHSNSVSSDTMNDQYLFDGLGAIQVEAEKPGNRDVMERNALFSVGTESVRVPDTAVMLNRMVDHTASLMGGGNGRPRFQSH